MLDANRDQNKGASTAFGWKKRKFRLLLQELLLFPFLRLFCKSFELRGLEKLSDLKGPCIIVSNHSSHADTAAILMALPEHIRANLAIAAASDYFFKNKLMANFLTVLLNIFPFDRNSSLKAFRDSARIIKSGASLLIYPQGSRDDEAVDFRPGFAALACQFKLPVIVVSVAGSEKMLPKGASWPKRADLQISFSSPIDSFELETAQLRLIAQTRLDQLKGVA